MEVPPITNIFRDSACNNTYQIRCDRQMTESEKAMTVELCKLRRKRRGLKPHRNQIIQIDSNIGLFG